MWWDARVRDMAERWDISRYYKGVLALHGKAEYGASIDVQR